jgi:ssDNA-binding Zn-finger/Zn-ribbon topoisomerase 1
MYTTASKSKETQSSVIACPVCGSTTVKRTGRYGSFWGCSRYPGCHGTQPFKIDYAGQPCRHCRTPVVRQTHAKPPKPGRSYFAWWFKCPRCKAVYLVEAARRFFDATGTPEPSSAPAFSPDWVARDQAILPWQ